MTRVRDVSSLIALAALLFLVGLGSLNLTDRDEGSNAEAAREMLESGDWISPTLNGEPRFAKPALLYWLIGAAYRLFGVTEFVARLPSACFGIGLIVLHYLFLSRTRGPTAALLGGLMLLLNLEIVAISRLVLTDSVLVFWTTVAIFAFWTALHGEGRWRHAIWGLYIGIGLGTLTKGPIGFLVPLLAIVPYLTITRRWAQFWRSGFPLAGFAVTLLIAVPWYAAMLAIHGATYTASAQADTVGRFRSTIGGHGGTVLFYFPVLLFGFFPWSALLPVPLYEAWRSWRRIRAETAARDHAPPPAPQELELFAALWLISGFVFFSLSATRLPHYIAPLFPAAAILAASYWARTFTHTPPAGIRSSLRLMIIIGYGLGLLLAATPALYESFLPQIVKEFPVAMQVRPGFAPVAVGIAVVIGMAILGYFAMSEVRRPGTFWVAAATIFIALLFAIVLIIPWFSRYFIAPVHELAYAAAVNLAADERLIYYGPPKPSVVFYARRRVTMIRPGQEERLEAELSTPVGRRTMILLPSRLKAKLPAAAQSYTVVLERYGYSLLADRPMVQIPPSALPPVPLNPHR